MGGLGWVIVVWCIQVGVIVFVGGCDQVEFDVMEVIYGKVLYGFNYDVIDELVVKEMFCQLQCLVLDGVVLLLYGLVNNVGIMLEVLLLVISMDKFK